MFTLSDLRATLRAAGLIVDDVDGADELCLTFEGETVPFVDVYLAIVDEQVAVRIEMPDLPLDGGEWDRARRWLRQEDLDGDLALDDEGDTVIALSGAIDDPLLHEMPVNVEEIAAVSEQIVADLADHLDTPDEELTFMKDAFELHRAGRPVEAIAVLQQLVADDDRDPRLSPRARGSLLAGLADLLLQVGRTTDALTVVDEAIALLVSVGEHRLAALTEQGVIAADLASGDPRDGVARCDRLRRVLEEVGGPGDLDKLMSLQAQFLMTASEYDDAIAVLAPLEQRLTERASPDLATARFALGNCLQATGNIDGALPMLRSAEQLYSQANEVLDVGRCQVVIASAFTKVDRWEEALDAVARARATVVPLGARDQLQALDFCELQAFRGLGAMASAWEVAQRLRDELAADPTASPSHLAMAEVDVGLIAHERGDPATAIEAYARAESMFAKVGTPEEKAKTRMNLVTAQLEDAVRREKIDAERAARLFDDVMVAVRWIEEARQDFAAVADRGRWARHISMIFVTALMLGHAAGKHRRVVELLDRVQAQGLPDDDRPATREASDDLVASGPDPEEAELLAVRAALHDLRVGNPPPSDVDLATKAAGGPAAWRWQLWMTQGVIVWGVIEPDASAHSGVITVDAPRRSPQSLPADLLAHVGAERRIGPELSWSRRAQGVGSSGEWRALDIVEGLLVKDPHDEEPALAWELGRKLVPPVLAEQLRRRLAGDGPAADPLPLVIAPSPALAGVAFGLLGIEPPTAGRTMGRRLLEAAVVTMAAPSALVEQRAEQLTGNPSPGPRPVRLAVVNPTGDLRHTVPVLESHPGSGVDPQRLHEALRAGTPGEPGVMWWDGHAEPGPAGRPLDACWPLSRHDDGSTDERLSIEDLLAKGVHVPSRAVLFGCTTMGVDEQLTEWWGFPVALMYAGAAAVAASTWDLFDCPAAADFAAEVLQCAIDADDLATALRERQLRWLQDWEQVRATDRTFHRDRHDRHPHIWAGWSVVALHQG